MYSIREKIKHLRNLLAPTHAETDAKLLDKLSPNDHSLKIYRLSPRRYAEQILYALLDLTTAENIRDNRRAKNSTGEQEIDTPAPDPDQSSINLKEKELEEKETELKDKEDELQDKEDELNEKEDELNEKEDELNEKEDELNEKEANATQKKSDKSTKSTPASTGKTSKTKTSR